MYEFIFKLLHLSIYSTENTTLKDTLAVKVTLMT